jgi:hypothetical protein
VVAVLAGAAVGAAGCGGDGGDGGAAAPSSVDATAGATAGDPGDPVIDPGDGGHYRPTLSAADAVDVIDNPYLPLLPGASWAYEGVVDGERERVEVVVTGERREVMGIAAVVVHDTAYADGEVVEETDDWYAQDRAGTVWYLGEATVSYDGGAPSDEGSWEAGVGGALPGVAMPADPAVGDAYRQEYLPGEAEDMGEVVAVGRRADVAAGRYDDVVVTRDWTPLEPDVVEEKEYAPGVGLVRESTVAGGEGGLELVEHVGGGRL